jgi:hypothetical protein
VDFLGFPWILSSETRLINGLRGNNGGNFFLGPSPLAPAAPERERPVETMRKGKIAHAATLV